jgi:asparagine synthase (glutamine-hydrolysing)
MCAITGLLRHDGGPIDAAALRGMTAALAHRGPDGEGFHIAPGIGLGHRRLSVIDVAGGAQPMTNEDGAVVIVFNGEIYNFPHLRQALAARGHIFANHCDTEAVVHAWEQWGPDCVARLEGMFAFALWDRRRRALFLARDRLGKKPLYYAATSTGLAFASELRAFAALPGPARRIDPAALDSFFAYGYVPDPASIFAGIRKLPPAHTLLVEPGRDAQPARYWRPTLQPITLGLDEAAGILRERLLAATQARLMADVPLGAFLSGGVDSSGVVAAATIASERRLDSFTISFPGAADEAPFAAEVARHCRTHPHTETAAAIDWIGAAAQQGAVFGEPFADSSAVPTMAVCRLARRHVTVALSGDGGDEVFAGYRRHRWHSLVQGARRWLPAGARRGFIAALARAYPRLDHAPRFLRARTTLTELSLEAAAGYYRTMARVQDEDRRALFAPSLRAALEGHDPGALVAAAMAESGSDDALTQAQYADLATWLPGMMLTKVDRTSMAASLEVRSPLLDHTLVEWGLSLPAGLKLRGGEGKAVLKRALQPWLPPAVLTRPKQGFSTPLGDVLRDGMARVRARLLGATLLDSGLFQPAAITRLLDAHAAGRDHAQVLWSLLVFEGFLASEMAPAAVQAAA